MDGFSIPHSPVLAQDRHPPCCCQNPHSFIPLPLPRNSRWEVPTVESKCLPQGAFFARAQDSQQIWGLSMLIHHQRFRFHGLPRAKDDDLGCRVTLEAYLEDQTCITAKSCHCHDTPLFPSGDWRTTITACDKSRDVASIQCDCDLPFGIRCLPWFQISYTYHRIVTYSGVELVLVGCFPVAVGLYPLTIWHNPATLFCSHPNSMNSGQSNMTRENHHLQHTKLEIAKCPRDIPRFFILHRNFSCWYAKRVNLENGHTSMIVVVRHDLPSR